MLPQMVLLEKIRSLCQQDERIAAALLGGSFSVGEGDQYSDLDVVLYFYEDALPELDKQAWVEQIAPLLAFFPDDFTHFTAIFDGLIRAEFHFDSEHDVARLLAWKGSVWFPSLESAIIFDRTGSLADLLQPLVGAPENPDQPATVARLSNMFANLTIFALNVLERGELARTLELLGAIHRYLLHMARLVEGTTAHWPTPSRALEQDISTEAYRRFTSCTASLNRDELVRALQQSWVWGAEMTGALRARHNLPVPEPLFEQISKKVSSVR